MEEELEMEERRKVKLAKTSPPETPQPAATPTQAQETKKSENKASPKQAKVNKTPAQKEVKLSALEELAAAQWLRGGKPVDYLPSKVTRCEQGKKGGLVCFSKVLQRSSGSKTIEYRVKSVIEPKQDIFLIRYRNLVLDVVDLQQSDDDEELLGGYDGEVEGAEKSAQGFHVQTGWTPEHRVECKAKPGKGLDCMKDKTHKIRLVESKPALPKSNLAQGVEQDY